MKREDIDFHLVRDVNLPIHERLMNWARHVSVGRVHWQGPIWRLGKSNGRQWHQPAIQVPVDSLDGHRIEKAVSHLPEPHRDAIRWAYCFRHIQPFKVRRSLGVTERGLAMLIEDARSILRNRGV